GAPRRAADGPGPEADREGQGEGGVTRLEHDREAAIATGRERRGDEHRPPVALDREHGRARTLVAANEALHVRAQMDGGSVHGRDDVVRAEGEGPAGAGQLADPGSVAAGLGV